MSEVDWNRYNLPAIWSLISDVDVCTGSDRVLAWDGLASEMRDQHKRLLAAADSLAAVWPPDRNDSAKFFLQQVDGLAGSMQETLQKAEDTKVGLQGVLQAFSTAQDTVRGLASGRQGVSDDWMPRFVDHAEDKYDEHAQAAMREAEAAIQDHGSQIQSPSLFNMTPAIVEDGHHLTGNNGTSVGSSSHSGSGSAGLRATPIPVPVHGQSGMEPGSGHDIGSALPGFSGPGAASSPGGPVLSGVAPPVSGGTDFSGPPIGSVPGNGAGLPSGNTVGAIGGATPGVLPIGGRAGSRLIGGSPGSAGKTGIRERVSVRRAMPSGAVIGEGPEYGLSGMRGEIAGAMPMGGGGGRGPGQRKSGATTDGEADQQWQTDHGVVPVLQPDTTEIRHDPGPGVIGFDR
jgi:hypothetical protein